MGRSSGLFSNPQPIEEVFSQPENLEITLPKVEITDLSSPDETLQETEVFKPSIVIESTKEKTTIKRPRKR